MEFWGLGGWSGQLSTFFPISYTDHLINTRTITIWRRTWNQDDTEKIRALDEIICFESIENKLQHA